MNLLYVGKFSKWTERNEDEIYEALEKFDKVFVCVQFNKKQWRPLKGQPKKIFDNRVEIVYFKTMKNLLNELKDCKYILFDRG